MNGLVIDKVLQITTNIFYNEMAMLMKPELIIGSFIRQKDAELSLSGGGVNM